MIKARAVAPPFVVGLVLRVVLPWYARGFRYMDEHWQVIEPANHLVHGTWSRTVEWDQGLRSWIYPWLVSGLIRFAEALGMKDPIWIVSFIRTMHGLVSALAIPITFALVRALIPTREKQRDLWALGAAWVVAVWPFSVYCGTHTQGEMIGALFVLAGFALPDVAAGFCFGLALALKVDLAVAGLGFGLWQLLHRRWQRALNLAIGVAPVVVVVGLVDRLTWGSWFHSVLGHARVNLVEGVGNQWGVSPWYTHILYYFDMLGAPALLAVLLLPTLWRKLPDRLRAIWFANAFFVAVYCAIPHKEKRFLAPLLYTGEVAAFATLAFSRFKQKAVLALVVTIFAVHFVSNVVTYEIRQPWWDRIHAIHLAGEVPGIQKMFSPQWPAVFYLPRGIPSEAIGADYTSLREKTRGLSCFSVASDWKDFSVFRRLGFECGAWPLPAPESRDPVPWAYKCVGQSINGSRRPR